MTSKALTTLLLIFAAIIFFPVVIGLFGALIGVVFGIFGAIVGVIGSIFGAVFGGIGHLFDPFHWHGPGISKPVFAIILVIVVVLLSRQNKKAN